MENKNTISGTENWKGIPDSRRLATARSKNTDGFAEMAGRERQVPSGARTAPQKGLGGLDWLESYLAALSAWTVPAA